VVNSGLDEGKWQSTHPKERAAFERLLNRAFTFSATSFLLLAFFPTQLKSQRSKPLPFQTIKLASHTALGIMGYYRRFIYNYASIAGALRAKASAPPHTWRKGANGIVLWTDEEKKSFTILRAALTSDSILKHPNLDHPFELHTDASH
jgi:hypothetical protein